MYLNCVFLSHVCAFCCSFHWNNIPLTFVRTVWWPKEAVVQSQCIETFSKTMTWDYVFMAACMISTYYVTWYEAVFLYKSLRTLFAIHLLENTRRIFRRRLPHLYIRHFFLEIVRRMYREHGILQGNRISTSLSMSKPVNYLPTADTPRPLLVTDICHSSTKSNCNELKQWG